MKCVTMGLKLVWKETGEAFRFVLVCDGAVKSFQVLKRACFE